jgi:hypothetical protein
MGCLGIGFCLFSELSISWSWEGLRFGYFLFVRMVTLLNYIYQRYFDLDPMVYVVDIIRFVVIIVFARWLYIVIDILRGISLNWSCILSR